MKLYLAAAYDRRLAVAAVAARIRALGVTVTSRWLEGHAVEAGDEAGHQQVAREDLHDLESADWVVAFTEPPGDGPSRGGRHVEFGYALALRKQVVVVGYRENVFMHLPEVTFCGDADELIAFVQRSRDMWYTLKGTGPYYQAPHTPASLRGKVATEMVAIQDRFINRRSTLEV